MSTCPENDIHSVYLDNEMPSVYIKKYEAHVHQCPKCSAELEKMRALRSIIKEDSKNIALSQKDLDDSFERLKARMSYAKVTNSTIKHFVLPNWAVGAAAAALVFAIALPLRMKNSAQSESTESNVAEVATINAENMPKIPRAAIPPTHLTSLISTQQQNALSHPASFAVKSQQESLQTIQDSLTSVDVFRPDLSDKALSIKITLSPFQAMNEKSENIQDRLNIPVIIEASYDTDGDNQGFRK